ncbi:filamentous hemagglutinin family outer membrane protein [[Leptolyngbya] sp. PCC 7376]|uniref:two-partner secretion domain-containing protein n=1 Tax=[Leptolyngbya] sp. PCC 7376 TaxID=111781 RepID=UPI00029F2078|nr:filamentous hemagglutinin N-terminal domain-containing protein [[Leptolyngbya] sp. PCC 7376]AFY39738.1 filamentous hemagglutinin family outer membrane protein [[Leptolyngbya] sp. PCC 7376]
MDRTGSSLSNFSLVTSICLGLLSSMGPGAIAQAQVVADMAAGSNLGTTVGSIGLDFTVDGGTTQGTNLFHSFNTFSVPATGSATFNNAGSITNIFSRVTGNSTSLIEGELRANGTANLFLINPNGITFGRDASLNLDGSFVASTAEAITFDGAEFSATNPTTTVPLLTINTPVGLQFGATTPAAINVLGDGSQTLFNPDFTLDVSNRPAGLEVNADKNLVLIGGDLNLQGGNLTASTGNIELGAVGANQSVTLESGSFAVDYSNVGTFADITLTDAASAGIIGGDVGRIQVQGRRISLQDGSGIAAQINTEGSGEIFIKASESLIADGRSSYFVSPTPGQSTIPSGIGLIVNVGARGTSGNILSVESPLIRLTGEAQIGLGTAGIGETGSLIVKTNNLEASGNSPGGFSGVYAAILPRLGPPGSPQEFLDLQATTASDLTIQGFGNNSFVENLTLTDGGQILNSSFGLGNAGQTNIKARNVELTGFGTGGPSSIQSAVESFRGGNGGSIVLEGDRLVVTGGAQISSSTVSLSNPAGNVEINMTDSIELTGQVANGRSGIFANALSQAVPSFIDPSGSSNSAGDGGDISLITGKLVVSDGATINVGNFASNPNAPATTQGLGAAGNIEIVAGDVEVTNGSVITSDAALSNSAGNITISTPESGGIVFEQGTLSASGGEGNIKLRSPVVILDDLSLISANGFGTGNGGNILILSEFLIGTNNSDITANAEQALGGRVAISGYDSGLTIADLLSGVDIFPEGEAGTIVLGLEVRDRLTPLNDITVTSELGVASNGRVIINTQKGEVGEVEVSNPNPLNDLRLVEAVCQATQADQLVISGRGGLPTIPSGLRTNIDTWEDMRFDAQLIGISENGIQQATLAQPTTTASTTTDIIQAQSLVKNAKGQYELVSTAAQSEPMLLAQNDAKGCPNLPG